MSDEHELSERVRVSSARGRALAENAVRTAFRSVAPAYLAAGRESATAGVLRGAPSIDCRWRQLPG